MGRVVTHKLSSRWFRKASAAAVWRIVSCLQPYAYTFHGDAVSATSRLLPFFSSWTASTIAELAPPPRVVPPRWILYFMRTLAQLVQLVMGRAVPNHPAPALQSLERYRLQLIQ